MTVDPRVLLVDDDEAVLRVTAELMRQAGYRCDCVPDGDAAIGRLKREAYDVVIADIQMPGNEGLALLREMRRQVVGPPVPVILVTGYPSIETAIDAVSLQVVAYLTKPVEVEELMEKTRQAIALSGIQRNIQNMRDGFAKVQRETIASAAQRLGPPSPMEVFVNRTLANISASVADLQRMSEALVARKPLEEEPCFALNCARGLTLQRAVDETIAVLERTKGAFRSRELGALRRKLEEVRKLSSASATLPESF